MYVWFSSKSHEHYTLWKPSIILHWKIFSSFFKAYYNILEMDYRIRNGPGVLVKTFSCDAQCSGFETQERDFIIFTLFFYFKTAVTFFGENWGTTNLQKILHIYLEKLGISMNRACPRVLTFLIVHLVKSVPNFHRGSPHCEVARGVVIRIRLHHRQT